jgi:CHAT domain-containing protein
VADPAFPHELFPRLAPLRASRSTPQLIATWFPSRALAGPEATAAALVEELGQADILHFGGHALQGGPLQGEPALVLAASGDDELTYDEALLTVDELPPAALSHLRLAVLAACDTGRAEDVSSGQAGAFSATLLAAGTNAVLAARWPVDDRDTEIFFRTFYEQLARVGSVADALAATQRALRKPDGPLPVSAWAAFGLFGTDVAIPPLTPFPSEERR